MIVMILMMGRVTTRNMNKAKYNGNKNDTYNAIIYDNNYIMQTLPRHFMIQNKDTEKDHDSCGITKYC